MSKRGRLTTDQLRALVDPGATGDNFRIEAGAKAAASGRGFERDLAAQHTLYRLSDVAFLEPLNMPTAPWVPAQKNRQSAAAAGAWGKGPPLRRITGAAPYDFSGTLGEASGLRGRSLVVEAKRMTKRAASLPVSDHAGLGADQLAVLVELWKRWGAVSVLVWNNADQVGVLGPDQLSSLQGRIDGGGVRRIERERFTWLEPGDLDYLAAVLPRIPRLDEARAAAAKRVSIRETTS